MLLDRGEVIDAFVVSKSFIIICDDAASALKEWDKTWWVPVKIEFSELPPEEQVDWLDLDRDKANDETLIDLTDPKTGKRWLAVDGHARWSTKSILAGPLSSRRPFRQRS